MFGCSYYSSPIRTWFLHRLGRGYASVTRTYGMHELDALRAIITDPMVACPLIFVFIRSGVASGCPSSWAHVGRGIWVEWWPGVTYSYEELRRVRHATIMGSGY